MVGHLVVPEEGVVPRCYRWPLLASLLPFLAYFLLIELLVPPSLLRY